MRARLPPAGALAKRAVRVREPASEAGAKGENLKTRASDNRHYVRREKANGRQARRTSLFDVRRAAQLRNARLSDDRPIRLGA
jgi:hypothetical protein